MKSELNRIRWPTVPKKRKICKERRKERRKEGAEIDKDGHEMRSGSNMPKFVKSLSRSKEKSKCRIENFFSYGNRKDNLYPELKSLRSTIKYSGQVTKLSKEVLIFYARIPTAWIQGSTDNHGLGVWLQVPLAANPAMRT